jgi:hypothetical protein
MKSTITIVAAAGASLALFSSCARDDGQRMTLAERWKAMADRQDAAARDFVRTDSMETVPQSNRSEWSAGTLRSTSAGTGL